VILHHKGRAQFGSAFVALWQESRAQISEVPPFIRTSHKVAKNLPKNETFLDFLSSWC